MNPDLEDRFWNTNCCGCEKPMTTSRYVNVMLLDKKATWENPAWSNVLLKEGIPRINRAIAVLCDSCTEKKATARFAIEYLGGEIIYHPVGELEKLFSIRPDMLIEE